MMSRSLRWRVARLTALLLTTVAMTACLGRRAPTPIVGEQEADRFLFDRGTESLAERRWFEAREYFDRLVESYPQSPYRQDAKLGIGDTYIGEGRTESMILAVNEFQEFLRFFPLSPRADYAQYRLAFAQSRQILSPQRDQAATRATLAETATFMRLYPSSPLLPEVQKVHREARDRLSDAEFRIGLHYFRTGWYPGAIPRFEGIVKEDPSFSRVDEVYFYLAEALMYSNRATDAVAYYEMIVKEYTTSDHVRRAEARLVELKR
jgi:outer membrane assembly lipoprotein YfiO